MPNLNKLCENTRIPSLSVAKIDGEQVTPECVGSET